MSGKQKITTFLLFDGTAEQAANHYASIFANSRIQSVTRFGAKGPSGGDVMSVAFELEGQEFVALNGGPKVKFTEAISLLVNCETQAEVDELWNKLSAGGEESMCGWLKHKFGLSWQIIPVILIKLLQDKDPDRSKRVMQAMLQMRKIDIARLEQAHAGR